MNGHHHAAAVMVPFRSQASADVEFDDRREPRNSPSSSSTSSAPRRHFRTRDHRRGPWSDAEDQALRDIITEIGAFDWASVCKNVPGRNSKQCRERWYQNLRPDLDTTPIRPDEARLIEDMYAQCGPKWADIARALGSRSDNAVKNWWNGNQNRKKRKDRDRTRADDHTKPAVYASPNYHHMMPHAYHQSRPPFSPTETTDYYEHCEQHRHGYLTNGVGGTYRPNALPSPSLPDSPVRSQSSYTLSPGSHYTPASSTTLTPIPHQRPILPPPQLHEVPGHCVPQLPLPSQQSDFDIPRSSNNTSGHEGHAYGQDVHLPPLQPQAWGHRVHIPRPEEEAPPPNKRPRVSNIHSLMN